MQRVLLFPLLRKSTSRMFNGPHTGSAILRPQFFSFTLRGSKPRPSMHQMRSFSTFELLGQPRFGIPPASALFSAPCSYPDGMYLHAQ
jgi:hypothetical protein